MFFFEEKNGIKTDEVTNVYDYIRNNCNYLNIVGLMTIGSYEASINSEERNPDFDALIKCREDVCKKFNLDFKQVELSMGMSHDFEQAVIYLFFFIKIFSSLIKFKSRLLWEVQM